MRKFIAFAFSIPMVVAVSLAADTPAIKRVPVKQTSAASGKEMFAAYCSTCHGLSGKGDGPAAAALKAAPSDLTRLAGTNGGKYPDLRVAEAIAATDVPAHGSKEMPIWGSLFKSLGAGTNDQVQMRITNLTAYIKSIQAK
jgi:mono/diheme cytochrome c family protein